MTRCALAAAVVVTLALPAPAGATVTASTVDTTGGPFMPHDEANTSFLVHGHVTSDDTSNDKVKFVCKGWGEDLGPGDAGIPIEPDGSVSVDLGLDMDQYYCEARFVPFNATAPYNDPAFVPSVIGVIAYFDWLFDPPDDVLGPWDWFHSAAGPQGYADGYSLGDCAIFATYTINANYEYYRLLACSGIYGQDPTDTTHSMVRLNGVDAMLPWWAHERGLPPAEIPRITNLKRGIDTQTGEVSASATEGLAACDPSCSSPVPADVHVDHSWHADHGGLLATWVDVWHNDRSAPVTLDVGYILALDNAGPSEFQWPGQASAAPADGPLPAPPAGSGFMRAVSDPAQLDGTQKSARGAIVWSTTPDAAEGVATANGVILRYHRTIAAGGSFRVMFGVATTIAQADADALATELITAMKPAITITSPDDGTTANGDTVTVSGTSTDDTGAPAVAVNGVAATVAGDGSWSAVLPVTAEPTTLTATATDVDGNTASATRTVHKPPSAGAALTTTPPVVLPITIQPSLKSVRIKVAKNGTVTVSALVPSAGRFTARLRANLAGRRRTVNSAAAGKTLTVSSVRKTVTKAGRVTVKLKPSKRARAVLRKRSLRATLALGFTSSGKTATASRKLRLKRLPR